MYFSHDHTFKQKNWVGVSILKKRFLVATKKKTDFSSGFRVWIQYQNLKPEPNFF